MGRFDGASIPLSILLILRLVSEAEVDYIGNDERGRGRMIFLRRESLKQYIRWYPVTSIWIVINLVVFGLMELYGSSTNSETLIRFGAMYHTPFWNPELWRYITSVFVHIGGMHLIMNSFFLYVFAPPLERMLGSFKYAIFYLLSGVAGNLVSQWMASSYSVSAGASGAIYGIFGAYLYLSLYHKYMLDRQSQQTVYTMLAIGVVFSLIMPQINLSAHLGGLAGGFLLMAATAPLWRNKRGR
ncbi:Rhomboid protease gluP [Chlamydia abortus]|nr:Rhomboid protease gluP [Chlamydia abortus]